jgi:hypothetical protein
MSRNTVKLHFLGDIAQAFPTLVSFSNLELIGILVALSAVFGVFAFYTFRWRDYRAREQGLIDRVTNYKFYLRKMRRI